MITFEKSAGAIVFRRNSGEVEYLLLKYRSGHWDLPKGHLEEGETEEDAARRETEEETGIKNLEIMGGFRKNIYYFYRAKGEEREKRFRDKRKINIFKRVTLFLAETKMGDTSLSHEHLEYQWLKYEDALQKATHKAAKKLLMKSNKYLKDNNSNK